MPLAEPLAELEIARVDLGSDAGEDALDSSMPSKRSKAADDLAPGEACPDVPLPTRVEALLMASDRPLSEGRMAEILSLDGKNPGKRITGAIEELNTLYEQSGRSFRAQRLAGGWQILTLPALGPVLNRLHTERQQSRLSQPAMETLAIVAYRQPIMRAELEAIRGVASGEVLRSLLDRRLIKIVGRAEELGRPMLYGTTKEFLKVFGLASLEDLPSVKGLASGKSTSAGPTSTAQTEPAVASAEGDNSSSQPPTAEK